MADSHRGVWVAPWKGFAGETVLYVMDGQDRLVIDPITVPLTFDSGVVAAGLWKFLDVVDPQGSPSPIVAPVFGLIVRNKPGERRYLHLNV